MFDISRDNQVLPWSVFIPIAKTYEAKNGNRGFEAPLSNPSVDLQGEQMDMTGLWKGLETWDKFKRPVDLDHLFERTRDPSYLIGKGIERFVAPHPHSGLDVPWMRGEFYWDGKKGKPLAKAVVEHLECGGDLGISVAGFAAVRDATDKSRIVQPVVTSVGVTAVPVVSENSGTIALTKSLTALAHHHDVRLPIVPETRALVMPMLDEVRKALECAPGLPHEGPGVSALAVEDLGMGHRRGKKNRKRGDEVRKSAVETSAMEVLALICASRLAELYARR